MIGRSSLGYFNALAKCVHSSDTSVDGSLEYASGREHSLNRSIEHFINSSIEHFREMTSIFYHTIEMGSKTPPTRGRDDGKDGVMVRSERWHIIHSNTIYNLYFPLVNCIPGNFLNPHSFTYALKAAITPNHFISLKHLYIFRRFTRVPLLGETPDETLLKRVCRLPETPFSLFTHETLMKRSPNPSPNPPNPLPYFSAFHHVSSSFHTMKRSEVYHLDNCGVSYRFIPMKRPSNPILLHFLCK